MKTLGDFVAQFDDPGSNPANSNFIDHLFTARLKEKKKNKEKTHI